MGRPKKVQTKENEELETNFTDQSMSEDSSREEESDESTEEEDQEPKTEVEVLREQVQALTKLVKGEESSMVTEKVREHLAKVMFFEGKYPVIRFGQAAKKGGELLAEFWIINEEGKEERKVYNYLELLNEMPRHWGKIVKQVWKKEAVHQGAHPTYLTTQNPDPANMSDESKMFQSRRILLEEVNATCEITIQMIEGPMKGKKLHLNSEGQALNV